MKLMLFYNNYMNERKKMEEKKILDLITLETDRWK